MLCKVTFLRILRSGPLLVKDELISVICSKTYAHSTHQHSSSSPWATDSSAPPACVPCLVIPNCSFVHGPSRGEVKRSTARRPEESFVSQ
jgi:hypothetical protein